LVASGVTGYVGAGCSNDIDFQLRMVVDDGLLAGPRITPGSRFINSTGHDAAMAKWWYDMRYHPHDVFADGPEEFRKVTRTEIFQGAEIVKVIVTSGHGGTGRGRGLAHDELAAVVAAAHDRNKRVRAHCVWRDVIEECLDLGVDVIDHGDELDEKCIEMMAERGTTWIPSLWFQRLLRNLPPGAISLPTEDADRNWDNVVKMLPVANEAGVRIVPGDDYAPIRGGVVGEELSIYVNEVGIKPLDALRWATRNGGEFSGQGAGEVKPGMLADIIVVDTDPSLDISVLESPDRIRAVMLDGRFVKDSLSTTAAG
jgi:imidazolonepropionase-like amidohydrolase